MNQAACGQLPDGPLDMSQCPIAPGFVVAERRCRLLAVSGPGSFGSRRGGFRGRDEFDGARLGFRQLLRRKRFSPHFIQRYADDLFSTATVELSRKLAEGEEIENPAGWLIACAWRRTKGQLEAEARRPQSVSTEATGPQRHVLALSYFETRPCARSGGTCVGIPPRRSEHMRAPGGASTSGLPSCRRGRRSWASPCGPFGRSLRLEGGTSGQRSRWHRTGTALHASVVPYCATVASG
jgi:hypothetical protein